MEETEMKEKTNEIEMQENVKQETEKIINSLIKDGINVDNVNFLGKVIDIHKDIANEEYWCEKKEAMNMRYGRNYAEGRGNYGNYGNYDGMYGRGRRRDSRGRYMESGRGGSYRGYDMLDEMSEHYGRYSEGKESYGTDQSTLKALEEMLHSAKKFMKHLEENAESEEEVAMIKETAREIGRM